MTEKYTLTPEHEAQFKPWCEKWVQIALSTKPMSQNEQKTLRKAVRGLYKAASYTPPPHSKILFMSSPMSAAIAGSLAAGYWWLQDHENQQRELFDSVPDEKTIAASMRKVAVDTVDTGVERLIDRKSDIPAKQQILEVLDSLTELNVKSTRATPDDQLVEFFIAATSQWNHMYAPGNLWASWACFLSFFRYVVELPIDYSDWDHYEKAARHGGPRMMHSRFCIVSDRPEILKQDEEHRPHNEVGPSHKWRDGWELYNWHGVRIPKEWIMDKDNMDPSIALTWENIEQRRAAAEIIGWGKVIEKLNPKVLDEDSDPQIGTLLEVDLPDSPGERFLRVKCGTGRDFVLPVSREFSTALEANAATFRLDPEEYRMLEVRT